MAASIRYLLAFVVFVIVPMGARAEQPMAAQEPDTAPAAEAPAAAPEPPPAPPKAKTPEGEIRAQLAGTSWDVELTMIAGEKTKKQKDTLTFDDRQIKSDRLTKAGYPATNYTLTIGDDGVPVWETMQTKEGEGVAFWRGELHGTVMRGVLSKHPTEGAPEDASFTGREATGKTVGKQMEPAPAASAASVPSTEPPKPVKKKKKR